MDENVTRGTLGVVAVVVASAGVSLASFQGDARASARRALEVGEPSTAVELLRPLAAAAPRDVALAADLAEALSSARRYDEALAVAQTAIKAGAGSATAWRAMAIVRLERHELDEARAAIDEGLTAQPDDARLLVVRGRLAWARKWTSSAIDALTAAARDRGAAGEASYWIGRIYAFKGWEAEGAFPGWHEEIAYRPRAIAAFREAISARPEWFAPRVALGTVLLSEGGADDALAAFDKALAGSPGLPEARVGRWRALQALGRVDEATREIEADASSADARRLEAARQGVRLLARSADAEALATRILSEHPDSPGAERILVERVAAAAQGRNNAAVIEQGTALLRRFPYCDAAPEVYDALIAAYQATPATSIETLRAAVDRRIKVQPDPGAYVAGGTALAGRRAELARVTELARESEAVAQRFIDENLGSYKLDGKVEASRERSRAAAADLVGWAAFLQKDMTTASQKLGEAERLSRGNDMAIQFHLGELTRSQGNLEAAREHYLNALTIAAGPPPMKDGARKALGEVYVKLGNEAAGFDAFLTSELDRRREARRLAMVQSNVGRPVPGLKATTLDGRSGDLLAERGNVVLLNFFASW